VPLLFILCRFAYRAFIVRHPIVTFDDDGVTDTRHTQPFVPWSDIGHISLGWGGGAYHYLRFQFRTREIAEHYAHPSLGLSVLWTRAHRLGDYNLYLLSLRCSRNDVLQSALRFQKRSVTKMVKAMNQDGARDFVFNDPRE
jgi:hypothetical protein